jgi:type I restriction enzyme, S subunit
LTDPINKQQLIDGCLASIDELIDAQTKKLELLKKHKKGLMQKLVRPEGSIDGDSSRKMENNSGR